MNQEPEEQKHTYSIGFKVSGPVEAFYGATDIIGEAEKAAKDDEADKQVSKD